LEDIKNCRDYKENLTGSSNPQSIMKRVCNSLDIYVSYQQRHFEITVDKTNTHTDHFHWKPAEKADTQ
jgi:hypothetical protein